MPEETSELDEPLAAEAPDEFASLREKAAKAEQQRDDMLRTLADYENSRKRAARDLELERKFAHAKLSDDLLPALDNLERALQAAKKSGENSALVQGVQATQQMFLDALKRHGVTMMDAQGQPFDPNLHQAVQMMPSKDQPPNTVLQVLQPGYLIHDRILRPASVIIATEPK
jgi:molecular chaperone GrpE